MRDAIYALATPPGRSAVAVIRVSGPALDATLTALCGYLPKPRLASLRRLRSPATGEPFDEALVVWMPAPGSFTGEDAFELQLHGGFAVVAAASEALSHLGLRPAQPGEFSRRAFEAGRQSLTQAEAMADLVDAETEAQRRQALDQLGGALDQRHARWRATLLEISALLGAQVDFPDEDLPQTSERAEALMRRLVAELGEAEQARRGEQIRDGFRVALIGAPNAGKSSLLNALSGRDAAIVTPVPGTTRDVIEVPLTLGSFKLVLADTAGMRDSTDLIEAEGIRRAKAWAASADLRLLVSDGASREADEAEMLAMLRPGDAFVRSKADLDSSERPTSLLLGPWTTLKVSVCTLGGTSELRRWLEAALADRLSGSDFPCTTRERHRRQLSSAREALVDALAVLPAGAELASIDVRQAALALEAIAGRVGVEDVLEEVFSTFCVGK